PNRDYSLRQIVRASASAPYYLDAIEIDVGPGQTGFFLDGGVSPHNNPAGELFLMTTLRNMEGQVRSPTGFEWPAGADNIFLLSLGTGQWRRRAEPEQYRALQSAQRSFEALAGMITDSEKHALTWLQALSEPADAFHIDANYANLQGMLIPEEPLLTFQRINPVLEEQWLSDNLGNSYWRDRASIEAMREIDQTALDNLNRLYEVGLQTGWRKITPSLFQTEFDGTAIDGHQQPAAAAKALQV
ncbi:MAG: hypothetical protein ACR2PA_23525, partial [Hyphomicrobiaceae bacterium]